MKGPSASWLPTAVGLLLLQVVLMAVVLSQPFAPVDASIAWRKSQAGLYFISAQTMAKRLLANPSARWDHYALDDKTFCDELGQGIWCARGTVRVPQGGTSRTEPWETYFRSGQVDSPLWVRVGDRVSGDPEAAEHLFPRLSSPASPLPSHAP